MKIKKNQAITYLDKGEVIAVPTDTVYGLAVDVYNKEAIKKVFLLKNRGKHNPLLILVDSIEQIQLFIEKFPPQFRELADLFWPGALSVIVPISLDKAPLGMELGAARSLGFRISDNSDIRALCKEYGPLAVTSANVSGEAPSTSCKEVENYFGKNFPILEGNTLTSGVSSTIIAYRENGWEVIRKGVLYDEHPIFQTFK